MRLCLPWIGLVTTFAACVPGQAVLRVGPGGYPDIGAAIAAAAPNDVVEVAPGGYPAFTLDKPLTIVAAARSGPIVEVHNLSYQQPSVVVLRPPAGTRSFFANIHFRNPWPIGWKLSTRVQSGTICFEDCTFEGPYESGDPGLQVYGSQVLLRRCMVRSGIGPSVQANGLSASLSSVFAVDCAIRAGDLGIKSAMSAGAGVAAYSSQLHMVRCNVLGGSSNSIACVSNFGAGHGIVAQGSVVWLADCRVTGGAGACLPGGNAVHNLSTTPVQLARTTLVPGSGSPPGVPSFGPSTTAPLLGLSAEVPPLVVGQPWRADYTTEPFWPVAVLLAPDFGVQPSALVHEQLLVPLASAVPFALLVADANGATTLQTSVPAVPALRHRHAFLQAFAGIALPARTQPALGGVIR